MTVANEVTLKCTKYFDLNIFMQSYIVFLLNKTVMISSSSFNIHILHKLKPAAKLQKHNSGIFVCQILHDCFSLKAKNNAKQDKTRDSNNKRKTNK